MTRTGDWRTASVLGLGAACLAVSCSVPNGMNNECEWPGEQPRPLNLNDRDDAAHLRQDIKTAEELGVRYEDTRLARGPASPGQPSTRDECDAKLFREIAALHSVHIHAVLDGRERLNSQPPEGIVYLPLLVLYAGLSFAVARRISARFNWADEKGPALIAGAVVSVCLGAVLAGSGHLWGGIVEMVRMGNTHMTYRAHRLGWREMGPMVFWLGVAVFWIVLAISYRFGQRGSAATQGVGVPTG